MGSVYLAHDTQLDRPVALKVPHFEAREGSQVLARFYREARAAATILHPNICPLHDVGEVDGTPYLTMAYVEGKALSDFARARPLTARQTALLVRKLALALQEAHIRGVIHRDLKPSNVMIDKRGEPMIMDFGLARRSRQGDERLTQQGATLGTPAYMAPEQISADRDAVGPACDIYSLGVILYELLTGRLPFQGDVMAMLAQVLMDEPPPPSEVRPGIDPQLEAICLKAMAKKAEGRYRSMAELAAALTDHLRNKPSGVAEETLPPPLLTPTPVEEDTEPVEGIRVSRMGGRRSVAQLNAEALPTRKPDEEPRRGRARRRKKAGGRVPPWVWLAGAGVVVLLLLVGRVIFQTPRADTDQPANKDKSAGAGQGNPGQELPAGIGKSKKTPGFVSLFNGDDLTGWEVESGARNRWWVGGGDLVAAGADKPEDMGWLLTQKDYSDFILRFEFMLSRAGNSGVTFRAVPGEKKHLEIQILDDASYPQVQDTALTGSLWGLALDRRAVLKSEGEWNQMEIELRGQSLRVTVNGRDTLRTDLNRFAAQAEQLPALKRVTGRIGLQNWDRAVRFRNLQLQDLSEGK
jgi:hypothetical protein